MTFGYRVIPSQHISEKYLVHNFNGKRSKIMDRNIISNTPQTIFPQQLILTSKQILNVFPSLNSLQRIRLSALT
jgi:hypothetical protein